LRRRAREFALFDARIRRKLAESQDAEYSTMNDEVFEKLVTG
jgi:hypothetical protein